MTDAVESARRETSTDRAMRIIRRRILRGELLPGERLGQQQLAADLGMSRVPLREALIVLADQGLLQQGAKTGFVVAGRSRTELDQICFLLDVLENKLLRTVAWPGDAELDRLRTFNGRMESLVNSPDWVEMVDLNHAFHSSLWRLSPLTFISDEVERIWPLADAYIARSYYIDRNRLSTIEFHDRIIDSLADRDVDALLRVSAEHRQASITGIEATFI
jgi:DNA-binding GntR family transcriptional regulator